MVADMRRLAAGTLNEAISADLDEIATTVALALTLDRDPALRIELRRLAGAGEREALSLELPWLSSVIKLVANDGARAQHTADGLRVDFDSFVSTHDPIRQAIMDGQVRAAPAAMKTVMPFFTPGRLPSRGDFEALYRWAPLIEKQAYRFCARVIGLLEAWRAEALREPDVGPATGSTIERYYGLLHTMAHLTLLTSSPGAGPWLRDMAKTFTWINWTPTFPLVRERTVWLAAGAARSAAVFGAEVMPFYLKVLAEARHPMKVFDALFGLVAIACAEEDAFETIVEGIVRQKRAAGDHPMPGQTYADMAYQTASGSLRIWADGLEPPAHILARLNWRADGRGSLATREALTLDPTDLGTTGEMIGLAALPAVMRSQRPYHFPICASRASSLLPRRWEMRAMLRRAWAPGVGLASARLH
jgi:hypothetical protein